ncbi:hypothetical protein [Wenjunlia tyrosinilytica]|uniref:Uncharacterized protein n=1 Tax=Wenjunlia tyrosinilytica TaxID=1544741 RepID=A0A917ZZ53_9ACTN|nr:hypothetical protein [Wenjunlia tyrosinilytica]GGP01204.1 hypothetical protein GCM10012280_71590 [Wenjunlia tyrosinilytica]
MVPDPTSYDDYVDAQDCDLCHPPNGSDPYEYPHCCLCGADGNPANPDCTCA